MVSFTTLFAFLSLVASVVLAEETTSPKSDSVEEKWWWGGNRWGGFNYGMGYRCGLPWINSWYPNTLAYGYLPYSYGAWLKDVNNAAPARRSVNGEQLIARAEAPVACKAQDGKVDHLVPEDCRQAVKNLVANKVSQANCKSCSVKLVSPQGPITPKEGTPSAALEKVAEGALKACGASSNNSRRSPAEASGQNQGFALVLGRGDQSTCGK